MSNVNEAVCGPPERQIRTSSCLCAEVCSEVITWNNNNVHELGLSSAISCIFFPPEKVGQYKSDNHIWQLSFSAAILCFHS